MSFLRFNPTVFVVGKEYEILVCGKSRGIFSVKVGRKTYYENNCGVLNSTKDYAKIRLPQKALDKAKKYTVEFRKQVNRKEYFPVFEEVKSLTFNFKPIEKTESINVYHLADVHQQFELSKKISGYFGDDLDLLIFNGDTGEVMKIKDILDVCKNLGDIAKGQIPVIFSKGNHENRGRLAEIYTDYFPNNDKKCYFDFEIGFLSGVVLDCGEDKLDSNAEYGGVAVFEPYRKAQTKWLKKLRAKEDKVFFAVSHISPVFVYSEPVLMHLFNIERDTYAKWNAELERLNTKFMLSGHLHDAYIQSPTDEMRTLDHNYPVIVGSQCFDDNKNIWGVALTISKNGMLVRFTDINHEEKKSAYIEF